MGWLLDKLVPLWLKLAAIVAILAALWGAWVGFKHWVSAPMVAAALKDERAKTEPVFRELTENFKTLESTFKQITDASTAERDRRVAEINKKTKDLNYALTQNKTLKTELYNLRGANDDFERLLGAITTNNNSATGASASTRLKQLSAAHQQCERALRESDGDLAETLGRLDEALSVVRALKQ